MHSCAFCGEAVEASHNYCNFDCMVKEARAMGGKEIRPNGLPIRCIAADGTMMENEHADHPDYKFPVEVVYAGEEPIDTFIDGDGNVVDVGPEIMESLRHQDHALVYFDRCVAVTIYECCYAFWYLADNQVAGGSLWKKGDWKLAQSALDEIVKRLP
jgi:hypothetical protein